MWSVFYLTNTDYDFLSARSPSNVVHYSDSPHERREITDDIRSNNTRTVYNYCATKLPYFKIKPKLTNVSNATFQVSQNTLKTFKICRPKQKLSTLSSKVGLKWKMIRDIYVW
jgi:hypothetical protein